ncbi:MAG: DUF3459 domain-containing protein, partial [Anaerolineales bacterium]|nr:DUF3459 domain-containing protein [Anaerolineales bacterium]
FPWSKGRDGCRTPMPWERHTHEAGFTAATPWLPIPDYHRERAVDVQQADGNSVLAHARAVVALRKAHPALKRGSIRFLDAGEPVLAFEREGEGEKLLCVFNLGKKPEPAQFALPEGTGAAVFKLGDVFRDGATLTLGARAAVVFEYFA